MEFDLGIIEGGQYVIGDTGKAEMAFDHTSPL